MRTRGKYIVGLHIVQGKKSDNHNRLPCCLGAGLVAPLAHVPDPRLHHPLVDVALLASLEAALGRLTPRTARVPVALGLTTTTTVRMVVWIRMSAAEQRMANDMTEGNRGE